MKVRRNLPLKQKNMLKASFQLFFNEYFFLVNKQINDKERTAAAMENPSLKEIVNKCLEGYT